MTLQIPLAITVAPSATALSLAEHAHSLSFERIPAAVLQHALKIVRDTFGVMLAGSRQAEVRQLAAMAPTLGGGSATIMGCQQTAASHVAALVNGTGGVSLELDEGNQYAINHPAIHIFPALWAVAEEQGATGAELLTAFIVGYEISVRIGRATRLRQPVHPFGSNTIVGTAIAAALILKLDKFQTAKAIELAAGLCIASSQTAANSGASVRNLFTGFTNHNGLLAARLAQTDFCGEPGALDVVFGKVLGSEFNLNLEHLFEEYFITKNYFKIYACSRWNHAPIEAVAQIMAENTIDIGDIATVEVHTFDPATRLSSNSVNNGYGAKHSIPYNVAARIVFGANTMEVYTESHVQDPRIKAILQKTSVHEDPALTALLPGIRAASVSVSLESGKRFTARSDKPKGGYDNPPSPDELEQKFKVLARLALSEEDVLALNDAIFKLPEATDLALISHLLKQG